MIITKYLIKETLKTQIATLFILFLIFFGQQLVKILNAMMEHDIPAHLVFSLLWLGGAKMAEFILPLSLFFALLMTYGKLYTDSEIIAMHACGASKMVLIKVAFILAFVTSLFSTVNVFWLFPSSAKYEKEIMNEARANPSLSTLAEGQFQSSPNGDVVLFIDHIQNKAFHKIFLVQRQFNGSRKPYVVFANTGHVSEPSPGVQVLELNNSTRYDGTASLRDFRITHFNHYQAVISRKAVASNSSNSEQMSMSELWAAQDPDARAEFHWRLTLIFAVVIMAFLVVPLSKVHPRQGRVLSMLPAMLLYLIFSLLQSTLRSNAGNDKLDPLIWLWLVNGFYTILAIVLNVWGHSTLRKLYAKLRGTF